MCDVRQVVKLFSTSLHFCSALFTAKLAIGYIHHVNFQGLRGIASLSQPNQNSFINEVIYMHMSYMNIVLIHFPAIFPSKIACD